MYRKPQQTLTVPITVSQLINELGEQATVSLMKKMAVNRDFNFTIVSQGCVRLHRLMVEAELC